MTAWLISIPITYLLGSIPFGYLLVRTFRKQDIRTTGSGNIGATNVARSGAKGLAIATLILDLGKGYLAVWIAYRLDPDNADLAMAAAISAVLGHIFPVWLGFRGGKGVATALGVFIAISPILALCLVAVFIVVFSITRYVSLASIVACVAVPFVELHFFLRMRPGIFMAGFFFLPLLVIAKHHENIRRLVAGTESRFGRKASA
jgi:glycerol-3-phosphate acyltransferase PlsY